MESFAESLGQAFWNISSIRVMDILDILIVAALIYFVITLVRKTSTKRVFFGILIILAALWLSNELQLYTINFILRNLVQIGLIALVVLFQPEIRRFLEKLGGSTLVMSAWKHNVDPLAESAITQVVMACTDMSASRTGALIVFERANKLDEQMRTGTVVDAKVTAELMKNIFFNKAPLHDGALIIRDFRIVAAGCMLPMTNSTNISKELGMRHRAGIGMSETSDAVVVIVSEETGAISVVIDGCLKRHLDPETVEKILRMELTDSSHEKKSTLKQLFGRREDKNNG